VPAGQNPVAYRLTPVYPPEGDSMATACVMQCEATGAFLSGSGGGGVFISPAFYHRIRSGEFAGRASAVLPGAQEADG
jgi:hypothetical protein